MTLVITRSATLDADAYGSVAIAFTVDRQLEVSTARDGTVSLVECPVGVPYTKDYDAIPGAAPAHWARRFDVSNWIFFAANRQGRRVGSAAANVKGRIALLWDIRVAPDARGTGVGRALLEAVEQWAVEQRSRAVEIETQNTNVTACRFYERCGYSVVRTDPFAYRLFPHETQLIWSKALM